MTNINSNSAVPPEHFRRVLQNVLLIWLDAKFDEKKKIYQQSLEKVSQIVATVKTFTGADECIDFLSEIDNVRVFIIVSDIYGKQLVPLIESLPLLYSIYVICEDTSVQEHWVKTYSKIKGIHSTIELICKDLEQDREQCEQAMMPISFNRLDPSFMYTQLLKEALLEIKDDDGHSIQDLAVFCRKQGDIDECQIETLEKEYSAHTPVWWYTKQTFLYSMLNRGLRQMDTDIIMKMGFFIRQLHNHIYQLYINQQNARDKVKNTPFMLFRGQSLPVEVFEKMKLTQGGLMSFNNFLSTSEERNVSLRFARKSLEKDRNSVGVLFVMTTDPEICKRTNVPYADVSEHGVFGKSEAEILFTTHTIFRIGDIKTIENNLYQVNLTLTGAQDNEFLKLTTHMREELATKTGWYRLGEILYTVGQYEQAKHLYHALLQKKSTDTDILDCYNKLGRICYSTGNQTEGIEYFQKTLEINKIARFPDHLGFAASYNNIGMGYNNMGEYARALSLYNQSLEIQKKTLPPNHPDFACSYGNIGAVYHSMGDYSKAIAFFERSLEVRKIALPLNHPDLAYSYNNIGLVYDSMGDYSKALSSYERSLEIRKIVLPQNHHDFFFSHDAIGNIYRKMGEYSKALSSYERSLEILKKAVHPHHPCWATSYGNIGSVYREMGDYSKALLSYERSLEIQQIALPRNHPDLACSYEAIGMVYDDLGD